MVIVALIGTWSVLSIYPTTSEVARALLASSAVLAIFAGLALNTPLSNLGSGVLVAFTQPLRLGDRVTVGEQTGFVEEIELIYTTLVTDDERRIFIPNSQLTSTTIVNRTIRDPRRTVTASLPVDSTRRSARLGPSCSLPCSRSSTRAGARRADHRRRCRREGRLAHGNRVRARSTPTSRRSPATSASRRSGRSRRPSFCLPRVWPSGLTRLSASQRAASLAKAGVAGDEALALRSGSFVQIGSGRTARPRSRRSP